MYTLSLTFKHIFLSILKEHKTISSINVGVIGIFFALLFINLMIGLSIINNAERKLDPAFVKRVTMTLPSEIGNVDENILQEIRQQPEVQSAFELYVILADIRKENSPLHKNNIEVESVEGDDLLFLDERFISGRNIISSEEIVLDKLLADSLEIHVPGAGVILHLERTRDGTKEFFDKRFTVVGIVAGNIGSCYVDLTTAKSFNGWASSNIINIASSDTHDEMPPAKYRYSFAYVDIDKQPDVENIFKEMDLNSQLFYRNEEQKIVIYEISTTNDNYMDSDMIEALNQSKHLFRWVHGGTNFIASFQQYQFQLFSANPYYFKIQNMPVYFTDDSYYEVILDRKSFGDHFSDASNQLIGKNIPLVFSRGIRPEDTMTLQVKVVGFDQYAMIPQALAENILLWQSFQLDNNQGRFVKPVQRQDNTTRTGRIKLYLHSLDDVENIYKAYSPKGYKISDRLHEILNIRELKKIFSFSLRFLMEACSSFVLFWCSHSLLCR